jgi:hypothetical protein
MVQEGDLATMSRAARAELLRVLTAPIDERADIIRFMYERPLTRGMAEHLIDLESDAAAHLRAIAELRSSLDRT